MRRELRSFQVHQVPFIQGLGQLKTSFDATNNRGATMFYTEHGIEVNYKNVDFVVPLANVTAAVFAPSPEPTVLPKAA